MASSKINILLKNKPPRITLLNKYMKKIKERFQREGDYVPYDKARANNIKLVLISAEVQQLRGESISKIATDLLNTYEIVKEEKKGHYFVLKSDVLKRRLITCEEAFSILVTVHDIIGHVDQNKILKLVQQKYPRINIFNLTFCIETFLSLCNECTKILIKTNTVKKTFFSKCYVSLKNVLFLEDPLCKYILIVADKDTHFINLRPLKSHDIDEVAIELYKIFTNYGIPDAIETKMVEYFCYIRKALLVLCSNCSIEIIENQEKENYVDWDTDVATKLREWRTQTGEIDWTITCLKLQWLFNTGINKMINDNPYKTVFGNPPFTNWFKPTTGQDFEHKSKPNHESGLTTSIDIIERSGGSNVKKDMVLLSTLMDVTDMPEVSPFEKKKRRRHQKRPPIAVQKKSANTKKTPISFESCFGIDINMETSTGQDKFDSSKSSEATNDEGDDLSSILKKLLEKPSTSTAAQLGD